METNVKDKLSGIHYQTGRPIELTMSNGYIDSIKEVNNIASENQYIIAPGFIDLQINGYKGYDFNDKPLTLEKWQSVINHLLHVGVTTIYPTIITNSVEALSNIFEENIKVIMGNKRLQEVVGGFHLEGPYISAIDGPRGAHAEKYIRRPSWEEFSKLQEKAQGNIKIVTLSPEWDESANFIKKATKSGVKVAIGHTNATSEQIKQAVEAGGVLSTHLGNGAHITLPRHPNYIWDQLAEDALWISVISDGHHLPENVLRVFNAVKKNKMILVSDSVALAGMEPGDYCTAVGGKVTLTENGRLHLKDAPGLLAGSAQTLLQGLQYFVESDLSNIGDAIDKASVHPAKFMNLNQQAGLAVGAPADVVLIDSTGFNWKIIDTYQSGKRFI